MHTCWHTPTQTHRFRLKQTTPKKCSHTYSLIAVEMRAERRRKEEINLLAPTFSRPTHRYSNTKKMTPLNNYIESSLS